MLAAIQQVAINHECNVLSCELFGDMVLGCYQQSNTVSPPEEMSAANVFPFQRARTMHESAAPQAPSPQLHNTSHTLCTDKEGETFCNFSNGFEWQMLVVLKLAS